MSLRLSSGAAFLVALGDAKDVDLSAYTLGDGATKQALLAAADRGATVRVRLSGTLFGAASAGLARHNERLAAELASHGIDACAEGDVHLKAAVIDGRVFLDDRNWSGDGDFVVSADGDDELAATRAALRGASSGTDAGLVFTKREALQEEAAIVADATDPLCLATETFGPSIVSKSLALAAARVPVRILLTRSKALRNPASVALVRKLEALGVEVRSTGSDDKYCLSGTAGWAGSANASAADPDMSDWGAPIADPVAIEQLRARFEHDWSRAKTVSMCRYDSYVEEATR